MRPIKYAFSSRAIRDTYIVAAKRTPIGAFMGKLSGFQASDLGGVAIRGALESIKLNPNEVDEVILGNVLGAGQGQAPARQASLKGGIGINVPCTTINKVCSSGLKSIVFGAQSIALGENNTVVAGGFESMSNAPHMLIGVIVFSFRTEKDLVMETRNLSTVLPMMDLLMPSTKSAWGSVQRKLQMISKSLEKIKMTSVKLVTRELLPPTKTAFSERKSPP